MTLPLQISSFNGTVVSAQNNGWPEVTQEHLILTPQILEKTAYTHGMLIKKASSDVYYIPEEFSSVKNLLRKLAAFEMSVDDSLIHKVAVMYHFAAEDTASLRMNGTGVLFNMNTGLSRFSEEINIDEMVTNVHEKHNLVIAWMDAISVPKFMTVNRMIS